MTILNVASGAEQTAVTVVTKAGPIAQIGRRISVPRGAVRVNATGKFLIPSLWDMHSHTGPESI